MHFRAAGDAAKLMTGWQPRDVAPRPGSTGVLVALFIVELLAARPAGSQVVSSPVQATPAVDDSARRIGSARHPGSMIRVGRVGATAIHLDGRLDETAWSTVDSITDFRQREPENGAAATERTVVRVLAGPDALYVGVHAYDRSPSAIRATQLRRDADLTVDDNVSVLIDSFRDNRGAFAFRTNPNGARWDAQLNGFEDVNANWNGIWDVAVTRDSAGWSAEFRIPFPTLRYQAGATAFGLNVARSIRRKNEEVLWQSWGRTQGLFQLLNEGEVLGLGPLSRGRDLELRPYGLARATLEPHDQAGIPIGAGGASVKAGLDAKLAPTPTLTADLTLNTDFAQVEADQQIINLTRFPLFFPEKREFFLESSGIFQFGTPGRAQLFYSRRIGLRDGQPVPIVAGGRLYGKVGPWAVGLLDARTGSGEDANNFAFRVKHDLFARSYIGAMALQRSGPGVTAGAEQSAGLDIDLPLIWGGRNIEPSFWIAGTRTPGVTGTPMAWRFGTDYPNDLFDNFVSLYRVDVGFTPTLGFVRRSGIWETTGHINFTPRPKVLGIRKLDLEIIPSWDIIAGSDGSLSRPRDWQTAQFEWRPLGGQFQSGDQFEVNVQRFLDTPSEPFDVFRGVSVLPGRYWWTRGEVQYETSPGRPVSVSSVLGFGQFYTGSNIELQVGATWRSGGRLIASLEGSRSAVRLPMGQFNAVQVTTRIEYAFNTRTTFVSYIQYNNEDQRIDFNLRFHWIPKIGDDVYVVWNSGYTTDPAAPHRFPSVRGLGAPLDGALVVKAVHRLTP